MDGSTDLAFEGSVVPHEPNEGAEGAVTVSVISLTVWPGLGRDAWTQWSRDTPVRVTGVPNDTNPSRTVKICLGVFGCLLESVVLAGSIFGWASMVYVLQEDGIYDNLCDEATVASNLTSGLTVEVAMTTAVVRLAECPDQTLRLSLAFTLAMVFYGLGIFPMGVFFDRFGLRNTRLVCMMMGLASYLLIGFTSQDCQWPYLLSGCLLGTCCSTLIMIHANVARLAGARSSTVNGLFTGLLNTAFTFQAVKMAHGNGFERKYSMMILSAFWVLGVPLSWLLPYHKIPLYPGTKDVRVRWEEDKRKLKVCVFSPTYVLFLVWFCVVHVCWQMYTNSYNKWITDITHGDNAKVSFYTDFQAWSLISALLCAPVAGLIIDYTRSMLTSTSIVHRAPAAVAPSMLVASTAALCMKGVSLWEQDAAIFASIVFFTVGKSFTYTSAIAYLSTSFPTMHFGKLFGIGYGIGGLSSLTCYTYLIWGSNSSMGFIPCNILILCTVVASYSCPIWCIYNYNSWRHKVFDVVIHNTQL